MGCFDFIRFKRPFWKKNALVPASHLQGRIKMDISKSNEAAVLKQLRDEGILATTNKGGVSFTIGEENSFYIPKAPVVLPPLYTAEDKIARAVVRRAEILEKKGNSAKQSDVRRKRAAKRRMAVRDAKVARVLAKAGKQA